MAKPTLPWLCIRIFTSVVVISMGVNKHHLSLCMVECECGACLNVGGSDFVLPNIQCSFWKWRTKVFMFLCFITLWILCFCCLVPLICILSNFGILCSILLGRLMSWCKLWDPERIYFPSILLCSSLSFHFIVVMDWWFLLIRAKMIILWGELTMLLREVFESFRR